ncbi:hypothetical protein ACFQ1M_04510 [Sungkyunkwania multivorans]|uniref:Four helix bundle protein n=1 Tax=Sungkyunkwania multivorans TaxID=1173618 RepID=A0ABW3CWL8_9FLAO
MNTYSNIPLNQLPVYKKAIEIFSLSRRIASYLTYDKDLLQMEFSKERVDHEAGDLVMQSLGLAPSIAAVQTQQSYLLKMQHAQSLRKLTIGIGKLCERLEASSAEGKEFLQLLRKELKKFRKLQRDWMATLR